MSAELYDFSKHQAQRVMRELSFSRARTRHGVDLIQKDLVKLDQGLDTMSRRLESLLAYYGGLQNTLMQTTVQTAQCQIALERGNLEEMEQVYTHHLMLRRDQPSRGCLRLYLG